MLIGFVRVSRIEALFLVAVLFKKAFEFLYGIAKKVVLIDDMAYPRGLLRAPGFAFGFVCIFFVVFLLLQFVLPILDLIGFALLHNLLLFKYNNQTLVPNYHLMFKLVQE